ncbi:MAG: hypothetical protein HC767_14075 [Akkermansiaceae bacterium]|nr:hypothetical protein [Akkermansiaceae bacterium]
MIARSLPEFHFGRFDLAVAVFFAFLLAVSTWHLHMSQTGRFYVQQMLFFNMAMLLYVHARLIGSVPRLVAALACLFLAFMSQPPAILLEHYPTEYDPRGGWPGIRPGTG